jgi:nucleoside-diphosphate-sugar epimerase
MMRAQTAWGERLLDAFPATGGAVFGEADVDAGLVYVKNLADALLLAGTKVEAIGQTYTVCDENGAMWRRFGDDVAATVGKPPPPVIPLADALAFVNEAFLRLTPHFWLRVAILIL